MTEPKAITETPLARLRTLEIELHKKAERMSEGAVASRRKLTQSGYPREWQDLLHPLLDAFVENAGDLRRSANTLSALLTDLEAAQQTAKKDEMAARGDGVPGVGHGDLPRDTANGSSETLFRIPLDPTVFVDGEETFNFAALLSFVLNGVRLRGQSIVSARKPVAGEAVASRPAAPRDEWRLDDPGCLDDVVVEDVATFRLKRMSDDHIWGAVYRRDGSRTNFDIFRERVSLTHEHDAAVAPVVEGARSPAEDLVAALTEALRLERAGRQGFREQLCDELGIRSTAREEDAIDAIRQVKAAWQVAIDRNIVLERENEALRTELTKQQERNSPQCRTESI